jgi:hypothetical protein
MTLERTVRVGELGGNMVAFRSYAVAYYDARGARTYARVWSTATPGVDTPNLTRMQVTEGGWSSSCSTARLVPQTSPKTCWLARWRWISSRTAEARWSTCDCFKIDIAAKDARAGATGWLPPVPANLRRSGH